MPPAPRHSPPAGPVDDPAYGGLGLASASPFSRVPTWGLVGLSATALAVAWAWPGVQAWATPVLTGCGLTLLAAAAVRRRRSPAARRETASPARPALHALVAASSSEAPSPNRRAEDRERMLLSEGAIAPQDSLTALANRVRFGACVTQAIARAQFAPGRPFAVLYLDFDRFKQIDDTLGHEAAERFLAQVSRRVAAAVRPGDTIGRLGGDEFAVLVEGLPDQTAVLALAERLQQRLAQPYLLQGTELQASACIGITFSDLGYTAPGDVLRDADIALHRARALGRGRTLVFDADWRLQLVDPEQIEQALRLALQTRQLGLVYQPICDLKTGQVDSFEALVRWQHPQLGPVPPAALLPLAEETGLMSALTDLVLRTACQQWQAMQRQLPAHWQPRLHLNVSVTDLCREGFARQVARTLKAHRLDPAQLVLEVAEGPLMARRQGAMPEMQALRALGVGLSVDDFGQTATSLAHLAELPVTGFKLDAALVAGLLLGGAGMEQVRAVLTLGEALGKQVVAEGIENPGQLQALRQLGCRRGQGYLLARPLLPDMALAVAERRHQPLTPPVPVLGEEMVIERLPPIRPQRGAADARPSGRRTPLH